MINMGDNLLVYYHRITPFVALNTRRILVFWGPVGPRFSSYPVTGSFSRSVGGSAVGPWC